MSTSPGRSLAANALVVLALLIAAYWLVRGIVGTFVWLANIVVLVLVIGGLLYLAGRIRKG